MCLYINKYDGDMKKPFIADKDIYTLKLATNVDAISCTSYYRKCRQIYGELYKSKLSVSIKRDLRGLNSLRCKVRVVERGLHSFIDNCIYEHINYLREEYLEGIILCKIPKGSKYYVGDKGDIVSDKLILIEPIIVVDDDYESEVEFIQLYEKLSSTKLFDIAVDICKSYGIKIGL